MYKLLSAEFIRLLKSLIFKLGLLFSGGLGAFAVFMRWYDVRQNADLYAGLSVEYRNADGLIFVGGLYLVFALAVFVGIFTGTEYADGTIRNKLMVGHTRRDIYLSKWIVCAAAGSMMHILYILVVLGLGYLLLDGTTIQATLILLFTVVGIMATLAMISLLLLLSMSIQGKAAGSVVCLLTVIILLSTSLTIGYRLVAPEYYEQDYYVSEFSEEGEAGQVEKVIVQGEKNSKYLTGTKRKVYEFFHNLIPTSQFYQLGMNVSDNLNIIVCYDCVLILVTNGVGMFIFAKKNLK